MLLTCHSQAVQDLLGGALLMDAMDDDGGGVPFINMFFSYSSVV